MTFLYKHRLCAFLVALVLPVLVGACEIDFDCIDSNFGHFCCGEDDGIGYCCDKVGESDVGDAARWISDHVVAFIFIVLGSILAFILICVVVCCICPCCILAQKRKRRGVVRSNPVGVITSQTFPPPNASYPHQQYQSTTLYSNTNTGTNMYPPLNSSGNTNMGFSSPPPYSSTQTGPIKY